MKTVSDDLSRIITYKNPPQRIVSLSPAITETIYHLKLDKEIVGRTKFCIYPKGKVEHIANIGSAKNIKLSDINQLKPDLIIAEKNEIPQKVIKLLEQFYPVYVFEILTIKDALQMILKMGQLTNRTEQATNTYKEIKMQLKTLPNLNRKTAAYITWKNPYMVIGQNTYIQDLLNKMGFINPFTNHRGRYVFLTEAELKEADLDYIFLATEPFPFKNKHQKELSKIIPNTKTILINGEMFWYGIKMIEATTYFRKKLAHL